MARRRRASSASSKGSLSRQLASITDTLAKASQRRDAEVKRTRRLSKISAVGTQLAPAPSPALSAPANSVDRYRPKLADAQLDGTTSTVSDSRVGSDLASVTSNCDAFSTCKRGGAASHIEDNPRAMLAELSSLQRAVSISTNQESEDRTDDLRGMLAEFDRLASPPLVTTSTPDKDGPRQMLAEITALSTPGPRGVSLSFDEDDETTDDDNDHDHDIIMLRTRLQNLRSNQNGNPETTPDHANTDGTSRSKTQHQTVVRPVTHPDPEVIPYIVALELEKSGTQWEHTRWWTTYLFSSGLNSQEAQQEKEADVARAEYALKRIIQSVMESEEGFRRKEEETKRQRRLIVSNLAAGADEEALERQFWKHRHEIAAITILPQKDPMLGTKTAHIDMSSRKAAIQASYITGDVYGLIFKVRLAVEQEG